MVVNSGVGIHLSSDTPGLAVSGGDYWPVITASSGLLMRPALHGDGVLRPLLAPVWCRKPASGPDAAFRAGMQVYQQRLAVIPEGSQAGVPHEPAWKLSDNTMAEKFLPTTQTGAGGRGISIREGAVRWRTPIPRLSLPPSHPSSQTRHFQAAPHPARDYPARPRHQRIALFRSHRYRCVPTLQPR